MPLKLNKIEDDIIRQNLDNDRTRLKKFLTADTSSPIRSDPVHYSERLAAISLTLGLELYQQEGQVAEIRDHFARAGREFLALISLDRQDAVLSPLDFEKASALAVCFCPPSIYENAGKIPMKKFFADAQALAFYAVLARYLDVLRISLTSGELPQEEWAKVEAECLRSNAARYDAQVNLAKLRALKAVSERDGGNLNRAIATLIEDHENEARRGENQRSTRGFVCLPALMLAHLGAARNLACTIESPYLPLQLPGR